MSWWDAPFLVGMISAVWLLLRETPPPESLATAFAFFGIGGIDLREATYETVATAAVTGLTLNGLFLAGPYGVVEFAIVGMTSLATGLSVAWLHGRWAVRKRLATPADAVLRPAPKPR